MLRKGVCNILINNDTIIVCSKAKFYAEDKNAAL